MLGFFTLGSLIFWLSFLEEQFKPWRWYIMSLVCFALALLSKGTAVVIPVWMMLMACYKSRVRDTSKLFSVLPLLGLSLVFGAIAIWAQQKDNAMDSLPNIDFSGSLVWSIQAMGTYATKLIYPYHVGPFHPYPLEHSAPLLSVGVIALLLGLVAMYRVIQGAASTTAFGFLFLLVGLLPTLQFLPVGFALTADRYTYIPFIGGFLLVTQFMVSTGKHNKVKSGIRIGLILLLVCAFSYKTRVHARVWNSDESLWNHEIDQHLHVPRAYVNLGQYFMNIGKHQKAERNFEIAISQQPELKEAHQQLGLTLQAQKKYADAERAFRAALGLDSVYVPALINLALNHIYVGELNRGFAELKKAENIEPNNQLVLLNLGLLYENNGDLALANFKYSEVIERYPLAAKGYRYRGVLRFRQKNYVGAHHDFTLWKKLDERNAMAYRWLGRTSAHLRLQDEFYANAERAANLNGSFEAAEFQKLEKLSRSKLP
jgi:Tfp pilus assembly protein PilF